MSVYSITIAPNDGSGATAVLQIDVTDAAPRLTKVTLVAAEGQNLSTAALSAFDAERLLAALLPATAPVGQEPGDAALPAELHGDAAKRPRAAVAIDDASSAVATSRSVSVSVADRRVPSSKASAAKASAVTRTPSLKRVPRSSGRTRTAAVTKNERRAPERVYRVMPDDFVSSFGRSTMADLAQMYHVPLYTVQSWVNTARKKGKIPPARKRNMHS